MVTASSRGIDLEIAHTLAAKGAHVVINGRMQLSVEKAIADLRTSHPDAGLLPLIADTGTEAGCVQTIIQLPEVDILVNNRHLC